MDQLFMWNESPKIFYNYTDCFNKALKKHHHPLTLMLSLVTVPSYIHTPTLFNFYMKYIFLCFRQVDLTAIKQQYLNIWDFLTSIILQHFCSSSWQITGIF